MRGFVEMLEQLEFEGDGDASHEQIMERMADKYGSRKHWSEYDDEPRRED